MNIAKQKVEEKSRKLQSKWTVTLEHGDTDYNANYEEIAKVLQEEIDWEVMIDILVEAGWTKIEMDWPARMAEQDAHEIKEWCRNNLQGNYQGRAKIWLFELEKDASMFILRWA